MHRCCPMRTHARDCTHRRTLASHATRWHRTPPARTHSHYAFALAARLCMREHAACIQVVDQEVRQLVLHAVEGADQCVDQHAVKYAKEAAIVVVLPPVEGAGVVDESQLRSCQQRKTSTMSRVSVERGRGVRAAGRAGRVQGLRTSSPEEHGQRAARRDGTPATGMGRPRVSRARPHSAGARRQRAGGRAREAWGSVRTEEGAAHMWGGAQSGQQEQRAAQGEAAAIPVGTGNDSCASVNWRLRPNGRLDYNRGSLRRKFC